MTERTRPSDPRFGLVEGVQHNFVDLPGLRMHVAEAGSGEPVLMLHGFPQHWWEWREIIPGLAQHYRVICPDLRGAGWTEAPPTGYSRDHLLADLVNLMDTLELDQVRLISHDMGSISGFALCLDHPERVERHVALGVPPPFIRFNRHLLPAMWHLWFQQALATPGLGPRLMSEERQRLPRYLFSHFAFDATSWSEQTISSYIAQLREPDRARAASALCRHLVRPETLRIMRGDYRRTRLHTPTLLVWGTADSAFPPELVEVLLRDHERYANHLEAVFVERAAHFIADERPDAVVDHALRFFGPSSA